MRSLFRKVNAPFTLNTQYFFSDFTNILPMWKRLNVLFRRIWPLVLQQDETARLIVAGDGPELIPSYRLRPINVEFTGLVSDLDALYERSRIICCPIITGGGTRLKLIEAAAHSKPMITTPIGAEGLLFENERDILIREFRRSNCRSVFPLAFSRYRMP